VQHAHLQRTSSRCQTIFLDALTNVCPQHRSLHRLRVLPSQTAKVLPCGHIFHAPCLGAWLQTSGQQKFTCPICRANLATAADDDGSAAAVGGSEAGHNGQEAQQEPRLTRAVSQVPEPSCSPSPMHT